MAIGTVKLSGTPQQYSQPRVSANAFGAGVSTALRGLGVDIQQAADAEAARQSNNERFGSEAAWATEQGEMNRAQLDAIQNAPENGHGITNSRYDALQARGAEFIASQPESQRERLTGQVQVAIENLTTNMYQAEFQLNNDYESREIGTIVNDMSAAVIAGETDVNGAIRTAAGMIETSNLSDADKTIALEAMDNDIHAAAFHRALTQAQTSMGPTRDWRDGEVVAVVSPSERGFLNAVAKEESGDEYNIRWNGPGNAPAYFTDFSDHPRVFVDNGHGDVSSAAGRYQITASTWDSLPARFRQGGFTPENQDRAAIYLGGLRYNQLIGPGERSFKQIITSGSDQDLLTLRDTLGPTWAAFKTMKDDTFLNIFRGSQGQAGGGTGPSEVPDVWTDPLYAGLSVDRRIQMEDAAQTTTNNILNQQQAVLEGNAEQVRIAFAAGDPNARSMSEQLLANGQIPVDEIADILKLGGVDREAEASGQTFNSNMVNGVRMANDSDTQAAAFDYYRRNGLMDGLANLDEEAGAFISQSVARSGVVPPELSDLLLGMYNSTDASTMTYGMTLLADMQAKGRNQFGASMPQELVEATTAWRLANEYSEAGNTSAVFSRFQEFRSPEQREQRKIFADEAEEALAEMSDDDFLDPFKTFADRMNLRFERGELLMPASPQALAKFRTDSNALFMQYYPLLRDEDATAKLVGEIMSNNWAPDRLGGTFQLSLLPPSSPGAGYEALDGSHDWVREDVLQSMGWADDTVFSFNTDAQSLGDRKRGEPASYTLTRQLPDGTTDVVMNTAGTDAMRIRPTISASILENNSRRTQLINMEEGLDRARNELANLESMQRRMVNENGLDSFEALDAGVPVQDQMVKIMQLEASRDTLAEQTSQTISVVALQEELAAHREFQKSYPLLELRSTAREIKELTRQLTALGASE